MALPPNTRTRTILQRSQAAASRAENAVAAAVAMDVTSNSLTNHSSFFVASISTAKTPLVPLSASHVPTFRFFFHVSYIANVTLEIFYTRSKK